MTTIYCSQCGEENLATASSCIKCSAKLVPPGESAKDAKRVSEIADTAEPGSHSSTRQTPQQASQQAPGFSSSSNYTPKSEGSSFAASGYAAGGYAELRRIASFCQLISYVAAGIGILLGLGALFGADSAATRLGGLLLGAIIGAAGYIIWQIIGASVSVILDVEANTRRTAQILEDRLMAE